ncbi:transporter substrate-binding domain-containing protein [Shewanella psychrotolerans]|nr:transporter substrate-binding domain-containing protein [Shewanella psychrotolerans]
MGEDSYPYQFIDDNGDAKGLLVDLWREWSLQTKTPVVFVVRHWKDSLEQLSEGNADIHLGMGRTQQREAVFDFANSVSSVSTYLYLRKSLKDKTAFKDLFPYRIGVVMGSSHESILNEQISGLNFRYYNSRATLLDGVIKGEVDVFAGMEGYLRDTTISRAVLEEFPLDNRLLIKKTLILPAVKKGNKALLDKVNQGFAAMSQTIRDEIDKRWLGYSHDANTLVIATTTGIPPFVDVGGDGEPHGMYIDIWKLWSKKTGINVLFKPASMADTLEDINYRRADIHVGYPESEAMNTSLTRAWKIYQVKSRLFSYQQPLKSLDQLKGKRVGAVPTDPYLDKLKASLPDSELKLYPNVTQMIDAARQGHISAFVASSTWTQYYLLKLSSWGDFHQYRDLEFLTDIYGLTRNEDKGLAQRIEAGFNLITQQELAQIERKWVLDPEDRTIAGGRESLQFTPQQLNYLASLKPLKIGYLRDWRPMEYQGDDDQYMGINSEISQLLFVDKLKLRLEPIVFDEWNELLGALKHGDIDIAGSVAQTADREKELLFSSSYWPSPWGIVTNLSQLSIFNLSQLSGKRLAIVAGYHLIPNLMNNGLGIELVLVPNTRAGIDAVAQGKADAFIEKVVNMGVELKGDDYNGLKMSVLADYAAEQSYFGIHPRLKPLLPILDSAIAQLSKDKKAQIYQHWVNDEKPSKFGQLSWQHGFFALLAVSLMALLFVVLWGRKQSSAEISSVKKQLANLGQFDPQTGLPNRSLLDDRLEQALLLHRREMQPFAILFVCFDNIRELNQEFGHKVVERAVLFGARKLKAMARKSDTLARFSENEFVMVLNRVKDLDKVCQVADGIVGVFGTPIIISDKDVALSVSIGVAMYPNDGDNALELLKVADKLMSRAVQGGGRCYRSA